MIQAGRLRVAPNPMLDWNVSNVAIETNRWNEIRPVKLERRQRIDGVVGLIDALSVTAAKYQPEERSVYENDDYQLFTL